jgi:hypothetical protein
MDWRHYAPSASLNTEGAAAVVRLQLNRAQSDDALAVSRSLLSCTGV